MNKMFNQAKIPLSRSECSIFNCNTEFPKETFSENYCKLIVHHSACIILYELHIIGFLEEVCENFSYDSKK